MEAPASAPRGGGGGGGGGTRILNNNEANAGEMAIAGSTPPPPGAASGTAASSSPPPRPRRSAALIRQQEEAVRKFAHLLSTKAAAATTLAASATGGGCSQSSSPSTSQASAAARSKGLASLLSESVEDDAVVLVLPSLDMRLSDDGTGAGGRNGGGGGGTIALPKLGETTKDGSNPASLRLLSSGGGRDRDGMMLSSRPDMAASVLTAASNSAAKVEEKAALEMNKKTSWTRSTVVYASQAVATNAADFFTRLIDSRLRAWTLLLLRHSLSTGDSQSRARLLSMLSASISVKRAETHFKTLALPESAAGQAKEADVILPLLFEVGLHLTIQDKPEQITLRAPGTISAYFDDSEKLIKKVSTRIDTGVMLTAMVDHARIIVFRAVANATKAPVHLGPFEAPSSSSSETAAVAASGGGNSAGTSGGGGGAGGEGEGRTTKDAAAGGGETSQAPSSHPSGLSRFRSALNISSGPSSAGRREESPRLQKARCSALRLNSVLQGRKDKGGEGKMSALGPRRVRSVKWDSPMQMPRLTSALAPSPKKQRRAETAAKLKSFKSFGRPHAGDFGSGPRNATFGEYGGRGNLWGRDGRMAHHPAPMLAGGADAMTSDQIGLTGIADKNATFDLFHNKKPSSIGGGGGAAGPAAAAGSGSAMPRTTTGLEKWLITTSTR